MPRENDCACLNDGRVFAMMRSAEHSSAQDEFRLDRNKAAFFSARPRDPPTLDASYGGFESAEAQSAKAEGGAQTEKALDSRLRGNERR